MAIILRLKGSGWENEEIFNISQEDAKILMSDDNDIEATKVFKRITDRDVNDFVCIENGEWTM